ncbi:MAG TPA: hypothetical protein VFG76_01775 [Candidatus Polarisedimenticolia bacterium]|nr:hypothetical protein [Candidatus Polarisedimenticolia bacterium]
MPASEIERGFLRTLASLVPGASGYRDAASRRGTDRQIRDHIIDELDRLRGKLAELKALAEEEGEEDMLDDLARVDSRMERTAGALQAGGHEETPFFTQDQVPEAQLDRACAHDQALLQDLDLLSRDVMGMKYETIGNLTLREVEGTLAAIELKVTNRKDVFERSGGD